MKKYILFSIAILAVAAVAAWNMNFGIKNNDLSNISLVNIEILAYGENDGGYNWFWEWPFNGLTKDEYGQWGNCTHTSGLTWGYTNTTTYTGTKWYCYDGGTENCDESECIAD
jgi:hypothetical protein